MNKTTRKHKPYLRYHVSTNCMLCFQASQVRNNQLHINRSTPMFT